MKADRIAAIWPGRLDDRSATYAELRDGMEKALNEAGVSPVAFSHVGFVVDDVKAALRKLAQEVSSEWTEVRPEWGEAFGCHIARRVEDGCEYEIIEPVRDSFLKRHLARYGAGVQHLSFQVADINAGLAALKNAGAEMADPDLHNGLHGLVAFIRPAGFGGLCLELCEVIE